MIIKILSVFFIVLNIILAVSNKNISASLGWTLALFLTLTNNQKDDTEGTSSTPS